MKRIFIITQAFYVLCLVPWMGVFGLSFMGFDSGFHWQAVAFVTIIGLFPVAVILCSIAAWMLRVRKRRAALLLNFIPMLWIIGLGIPMLWLNLR
ncbi:hypothetical protein [Paenibacillus gansuensis]|uniref:Uncharacterized protein n=1 Tax=Paenibacillus gansuensis TaxID=306542 RepID=A0ABW5PJA8_9BACL